MSDLELYFEYRCEKGLQKRGLANKKEYQERLAYEIKIIKQMGYCGYFLIVSDFLVWSINNDIPVGPGRGCFLPNNQVLLANGKKINIEEVSIGDQVFSHDKTINQVTHQHKYEIDEEIVTLNFENGKSITCTTDHLILTSNRSWVKAGELTEEDEIVTIDT